jgi:predicted DNA-binding protein (UPF0251 family)
MRDSSQIIQELNTIEVTIQEIHALELEARLSIAKSEATLLRLKASRARVKQMEAKLRQELNEALAHEVPWLFGDNS